MQRINPVAKTTSNLLNSIRYNFNFFMPTLDPSKHISTKHKPNNIYVDAIEIGEYQKLPDLGSIAPKNYQPAVMNIVVNAINKRYGSQLSVDQLNNLRSKSWERVFKRHVKSKDSFNSIYTSILNDLAVNIIVKESKWTWVRQQKERLAISHQVLGSKEFQSVGEFLDQYNTLIEDLILFSNFGHSKIPQAPSSLQKHLVTELTDKPTGVIELEDERSENNTFINQFMKYLHS